MFYQIIKSIQNELAKTNPAHLDSDELNLLNTSCDEL